MRMHHVNQPRMPTPSAPIHAMLMSQAMAMIVLIAVSMT